MNGIPFEFLSKMGKHEVEINGVKITAHTTDSTAVVDKHIPELLSLVQSSTTKVMGVDVKDFSFRQHMLILYASGCCLIIHLEKMRSDDLEIPASLSELFSDPNICFVGCRELPSIWSDHSGLLIGVEVGELAARVLNKPGLIDSGPAHIARVLGVSYEAEAEAPPAKTGTSMWNKQLDFRKLLVLTDEEVKVAIKDAFASCQIGYKLLTSL